VIVSLHVASGAAAGAVAGSRLRALALGALLHVAGDRIPHRDVPSQRFELRSGIACVLLLALARGALDPAVVGALGASTPDLEHVLRLPRPGGRKLFPSHRLRGWHRRGGVSAELQLVQAGTIVGAMAAGGLARRLRPGHARRVARPGVSAAVEEAAP
jgi:hypothetical protein